MQPFRVVSANATGRQLALRDPAGQRHLVRARVDVPAVGVDLRGIAPQLGFGLMLAVPTDWVFRVVFEQLDA